MPAAVCPPRGGSVSLERREDRAPAFFRRSRFEKPKPPSPTPSHLFLSISAERGNGGGFAAGFLLGGAVFGALGFLFAPQISAALLNEDARLKLPRFLDDGEGDGVAGNGAGAAALTKEQLADRIAQLNAAIDDVSSALKAQDEAAPEATSVL